MKKLISLALAGLALSILPVPASANEGQKPAKDVSYSFEGPFGTFDRQQLQRGYKVYKTVCANCHSMNLVSFRNLAEAGIFTEEQVKVLAKEYKYNAEPDENGDVKERDGLPSDHFKAPYSNEQAARAGNGGALPPDLSLITRSRPGWYGTFNQLWNGIGGSQYVYSVLTGYDETPTEGETCLEGMSYNPYFAGGPCIGMPANGTLSDGLVTFDDGAPNTVADQAKDVSAFLQWAADPKLEERKHLGFEVMIYLAALSILLYLVKKRVWANVAH
jgi:ubiquinol-cytochrome c reductase cytochrome c1 subunit